MRHPLQPFATRYLCCCCILEPNITCCVIAAFCIAICAFSGFFNFGIVHWSLYCTSLFVFFNHLIAGVLLFLGGYWKNCIFKLVYSWMILLGIVFVVAGFILNVVLHKHQFIIWGCHCHGFDDVTGMTLIILHTACLIVFDFYSILIVLGNIHHTQDCVADSSPYCE